MNKRIKKSKILRRRAFILGASKSLITGIVISKLYYLQILQKSKYGKLSESNKTKIKILYPERGTILDLYNKPIASNQIDYQLNILKEKKKYISQTVQKLSSIIQFSKFDLDQVKLNLRDENLSDFITIKKNLTMDELELFELMSNQFPYLLITKEKVRHYNHDENFSHVLGYVGYKKANKNKKLANLKIGISGVEKNLDTLLVGTDGWVKLEANSKGIIKKEIVRKNPIPGKNIKTNLILDIQSRVMKELININGAAVIIDCQTGGINCLASSPSFNNNEFSNGVSNQKWNLLLNHEYNPLLNRSIAGLYSPGSTYKLITALFAIEKMKININKEINCVGSLKFGNRKFHCWKKEGHGNVNLLGAIQKSCDCYFYELAKSINIDELSSFSKQFSFGNKSGIDIPNELSGIMPNKSWKKLNRNERWQKGETLNTVIGQGYVLSTPLQIALMTARIASGRKILPSILKVKNREFKKMDISDKGLNFIRSSMYSVVNDFDGTAFKSRLSSNYKMAGKTGTSQVRKISLEERESGVLKNEEIDYKLRDHSVFTGFAPYDNPRFAITIIAEHMGSGSKVAAPIAKRVLEFSLKNFLSYV